MRLLLKKIGLLNKKNQYVEIKVLKDKKGVEQIKADVIGLVLIDWGWYEILSGGEATIV